MQWKLPAVGTHRDEVLKEFGAAWNTSGEQAMADEIVKLREELHVVKKERMMIAEWLVEVTDKFVTARDQLEAARFMSVGWKRKANQLEDGNAEWAVEVARMYTDEVCDEIIHQLHGYATDVDPYEMGLPNFNDMHMDTMREIIRDALERKEN